MPKDYKLSQLTIEKLQYYIYILTDPRNTKPFYVGKGVGGRVNSHMLGALDTNTFETEKIKQIREIHNEGQEVHAEIIRHGLTEKEAFEVESALIDYIGIKNLTNIVKGHHSTARGRMTLRDIKIEYEAEPAVFDDSVLLININRKFNPNMTTDEIYEATRKHWKVSIDRVREIDYICSVYRGIIREVFVADEWLAADDKLESGRSYFVGKLAPEEIREKYIDKSVVEYWAQGSQNPIKYIGNKS